MLSWIPSRGVLPRVARDLFAGAQPRAITGVGKGASMLLPATGTQMPRQLRYLHALEGMRTSADISLVQALGHNSSITGGKINVWQDLLHDLAPADRFQQLSKTLRQVRVAAYDHATVIKRLHTAPRPQHMDAALQPVVPFGVGSYPSSHTVISFAAAEVLKAWFPAQAARITWAADIAGAARLVGGAHFPQDVVAGAAIGRTVGQDFIRKHGLEAVALTRLAA